MKKINIQAIAAAVILTMGTLSVSAKDIVPDKTLVTRSYNVSGFSSISVSQGIEIKYVQSRSTSIKAEVPENLATCLQVKRDGKTLSVGFGNNISIRRDCNTTVFVNAPGVNDFSVSSGAEIKCQSLTLNDKSDLTLTASSGGEIEINRAIVGNVNAGASSAGEITIKNLSATGVNARASTGAEIEFAGTATKADFTASSGADISAEDLLVTEASASASSGADISVNARQLNSSTSSGGSVSNEK